MGRGVYAGQPLSFTCAKCRLTREHFERFEHSTDIGRRFERTRRTRRQLSQGSNMHRWGNVAHEYRCLDCGHVGWSRHPDVARRALAAGAAK
jgi:rubredoxin